MSEETPREPPKVEVILTDPATQKRGLFATLKGAFAVGLMGAGVFGAIATVLGRKLVAWSETPKVLASCKEPVEIGVSRALDHFLLAQGGAMGLGFLLLFAVGFSRFRRKPAG